MLLNRKDQTQKKPTERNKAADVVCFGMVTPALLLVVDEFPQHNTGELIKEINEFISDDAVIVACLLQQWDIRSALITNHLGDDIAGRKVAKQLADLGLMGQVHLSKEISTPLEVDVSDHTGARTYFWYRDPEILATLDKEDLSLMTGSRILYVDWYDGEHILRPMKKAVQMNIPIFLNLEYGHEDPDILRKYVRGVSICQVITDPTQRRVDAVEVACKVLNAGAETVIVTLEASGCLVMTTNKAFRVRSPKVETVDTCGAGATFSAGLVYGYLQGWAIEESVKFATAAASLKCGIVGLRAFDIGEIKIGATKLEIENHIIQDS